MVQDKAHCAAVDLMTMGQALFKECNAGLLHQGGSLRASHKTPICVVAYREVGQVREQER
jgi:hypothetical protein